MRYNSLFISLLLFAKGYKTTTWKSHVLHIRENVNCTRTIFKISFSKFDAVLYSVWDLPRGFRRLNIKSPFNGRCRCCLNCFWNLGSERLYLHFWKSVCSVTQLMLGRLFAVCHLSNDLNISLPFIQLLLTVGNPDVVAFWKINSNGNTCFCGLFNSSFSCWQGWPGQEGVIAWKVLSAKLYILLTNRVRGPYGPSCFLLDLWPRREARGP